MRLEKLIAVTILLLVINGSALFWNLYEFIKTDTVFLAPLVRVEAGKPLDLEIPSLNKYDRVYMLLPANTTVADINIQPRNILHNLPLDVEGLENDVAYPIMLQRGFFYIANSSGTARITLTLQPQSPYALKTVEGKVSHRILCNDAGEYLSLMLTVEEFNTANNYSQLMLIHPYGETIEPDFQVKGSFKLVEGKVAYVNLILMSDEALYAFRIVRETSKEGETIDFNVNAGSMELSGRNGEFLGEKILFIGLGIGFYRGQWSACENPSATISVGDLLILNNGESYLIKARVLDEYDLKPRIYIFRKFTPTHVHILLVAALASEITALTYLALKWSKHNEKHKDAADHHRGF
jgi:hypothetical protein